jgi:hypothetical protein
LGPFKTLRDKRSIRGYRVLKIIYIGKTVGTGYQLRDKQHIRDDIQIFYCITNYNVRYTYLHYQWSQQVSIKTSLN